MAELCIVCLGDLRSSVAEDPPPGLPDSVQLHDETLPGGTAAQTTTTTTTTTSRIHDDDEVIAHLLPCKHELHHGCLKPWVERANSCPICRATFNTVELSHVVGGPVVDSYVVQDKVQEAEFDPSMIFEEDALAAWTEPWEEEPCILCGCADGEYNFMYCDGCDKAVHVFCAGFDDTPDVWYCENCLVDLENDLGLPGMASAVTRRTRRRTANTQRRRPRRHNQDAVWARVWQEVSRRLDLDLDFPFDEEPEDQRTEEQRREFVRWQRRFEEANRQGAANRLRGIANAQIRETEVTAPPESQEEIRAWNAFEKARESQDAPVSVRRRKRKATASPASTGEPEQVEQPQQKRPRLRRPPRPHTDNPDDIAESSTAAAQRNAEGPTFLSSLLREVETKPTSASSPGASEQQGQYSPREMSPMLSPASSPYGSPRAPSPQRPLSPPLSSSLVPTSPPEHSATFSPFSPVVYSQASLDGSRLHRRGRRHHKAAAADDHSSGDENGPTAIIRASSMSPSRLSYSAKEELQRMVKLALGSRYRDRQISKDQYTDINRDVSRKLYDLVGDASALSDQAEREKWQAVADDEVKKAVALISAAATSAAANAAAPDAESPTTTSA